MAFAPRPLTDSQYIMEKPQKKPMWQKLKNIFNGSWDDYVQVTNYPLCYEGNKELLSGIGFKKYTPVFLECMSPGEACLFPLDDETEFYQYDFLQVGMALSDKEDCFIYEIGDRLHLVGLLFCHTPDHVRDGMEDKGFEHGSWMLDQVVFNEQGKTFNPMYGQDCSNTTKMVSDLLGRVSEINKSFEKLDDIMDTTQLFNQLMREFYEDNCSVLTACARQKYPSIAL